MKGNIGARPSMPNRLERLLSRNSPGGRRRRQILEYLLESGEATKYRLSKALYGDGLTGQRAVTNHIQKLKEIGVVDVKSQGVKKIAFITKQGRLICEGMGLSSPVSLGDRFRSELSLIGKGLTDEEVDEGKHILTDHVVNVCLQILKRAIEQEELPAGTGGYQVALFGKSSEIKPTCDFSAVYIAAVAYYQEKYLLPQLYGALERSDLGSKPVFSLLEGMVNDQPLVALPIVEKNGVQQDFEDLVGWLRKVGSKIPLLGCLPFFLSVSPRLSSLTGFVRTTVQLKRADILTRILKEPRYFKAASRLER